ncbi:hypothetical protein KUCAC02_027192, partial [Chaenocephalus aceratus]
CASCLAQGGKGSLITHPPSLANYCLLTEIDKPIATTTGGAKPIGVAEPPGWSTVLPRLVFHRSLIYFDTFYSVFLSFRYSQ